MVEGLYVIRSVICHIKLLDMAQAYAVSLSCVMTSAFQLELLKLTAGWMVPREVQMMV